MFESLGFSKSKFSIFTIGEYRKHGFIKVGEIKSAISEKSAFSTWPLKNMFKRYLILRNSAFLYMSAAEGKFPEMLRKGSSYTRKQNFAKQGIF